MSFFAQKGPAIINDPDGFTNVRSGPGSNFNVTDTLFSEEFFYFDLIENSEWASVSALRERQIEGFVHKSRIQEIEKLDYLTQKKLIEETLTQQKLFADDFRSAWLSKDSLAYRSSVKKLETHSEAKYTPILPALSNYFCTTKDIEIVELFFTTMWSDRGSANEAPSFAIGECFVCQSALIIEHISEIEDAEKRNLILGSIEWGLMNYFHNPYENQEFNELMALLNAEKDRERL